MRLTFLTVALMICCQPAAAETAISQHELAQRIYELSRVKREVAEDGFVSLEGLFWGRLSYTEAYIKVEGCTAQFRFFKGSPDDPYVLYFEVDISMSSLDILPNPQTGEQHSYYVADQSWPPPGISGAADVGIIFFGLTGGNTFEGNIRSFKFFDSDNQVPLRDRPMEVIEGNQVPYQMDGVKDEETVRQLVAAFQEYQQTYCLVGS